jgi:hypothetical protein
MQSVVPQDEKPAMYVGDVRVTTTNGTKHHLPGVWVKPGQPWRMAPRGGWTRNGGIEDGARTAVGMAVAAAVTGLFVALGIGVALAVSMWTDDLR